MGTTTEIKFKPITTNDEILYQWKHERYGRAEFCFCPIFKDGNLKRIFIEARQQERDLDDERWVLEIDSKGITEIQFNSWSYKTDHPYHWLHCWCNIHETLMHMIYVPPNTERISFRYHFGNHLTIQFE